MTGTGGAPTGNGGSASTSGAGGNGGPHGGATSQGGASTANGGSSGCSCAVGGGRRAGNAYGGWIATLLGLLALARVRSRPRRGCWLTRNPTSPASMCCPHHQVRFAHSAVRTGLPQRKKTHSEFPMKHSILAIAFLGFTVVSMSCSSSSTPQTGSGGARAGGSGGTSASSQGGSSSAGSGGTSTGGAGGSSSATGGTSSTSRASGGAGGNTQTTGRGGATGGDSSSNAGGSSQTGGMPPTGGTGSGGRSTGAGGTTGMGGTASTGGSAASGGQTGSGGAGAGGGTGVAGAIYVSPDGNDSNPGTLDQPLKTVAKARDLVRTKNSNMSADITVYLRGGTYQQASTLTFANADSGSGGFYVKYLAYQNERPLITGGAPITGWKVSDATNNIYSASAGTTAFRQLYVNGVKAIRARTPNLGTNSAANFARLSGSDQAAHNLQVPASAVSSWKNFTMVEMHVMIDGADNTLRLASFTTTGDTAYMTFQSPEDRFVFTRPNPQPLVGGATGVLLRERYEFLDQPGEWYLDYDGEHPVLQAPGGEDMTTRHGGRADGRDRHQHQGHEHPSQARYLWFQGLTFAHSTYMGPSQKRLSGRAGWPAQPYGGFQQRPDHRPFRRLGSW